MKIAIGYRPMVIGLCTLILLGSGGGALAQDTADKSTPSIRDIALRSYRQLLLPIGELHIRTELAITDEQYAVFREYIAKLDNHLPPFSILVDSEVGVSKFLALAQKGIRDADAPFERFFDEVLIPVQSDKLLGMHLVEHGLVGFQHPALKARLELTDAQTTGIEALIAEDRKLRREKWTSGILAVNGEPDKAFDFRDHSRLSLVQKVLSPLQRKTLVSILAMTPQQIRQRYSLGF